MPYVDYFSPMVYPSHYAPYTFGFKNPNDHPYDVIDKTLKIMNEQRAGLRMVIRPWIQDFGFGSFPPYTADQILQEMQAAVRQRRAGLDDLERLGAASRSGARPAARGRGVERGHQPAAGPRLLAPMRLVVQRVTRAQVRAGGESLGEIGRGAAVLVGIGVGDTPELVDRMADRLLGLRYFEDAQGRTNLAIEEVGGDYLVVSQFTLLADLRRGRRPGFTDAAPPEVAEPMVARFAERLRASGRRVVTGRFGAEMEVELVNDGPFTLVLEAGAEAGAG